MRICPGPACGSGASPRLMTSGPPYSVNCSAYIHDPSPFKLRSTCDLCTELFPVGLRRLGNTRKSGNERFRWHFNPADHLHPFLAFLLFFEQLALPGDVPAIALGQYIFANCPNGFARDYPRANGRLDWNLELLARDEFFQLGGHHDAVGVGLVFMYDRRKGIDRLTVQQEVDFDQISRLFAGRLVVQAGITPRPRLEGIEEIKNDLGQRQYVADLDSVFGQVIHAMLSAAAVLTKLQDGADIGCRGQYGRLHHRLVHLGDLAAGRIFGGIRNLEFRAIFHDHAVDHVWSSGDQIKIKFTLQTLSYDLHVQQAKEANPESETKRARGFRLIGQGGIVELQLVQGLPEFGIVSTVDGVQAREHHRLRRAIAPKITRGRPVE